MRRLGRLLTYMAAAELAGEALGWLIFRRSTMTARPTVPVTGKAQP